MKLKRFQKRNSKRGVIITLGIFAVVISLLIGKTYAIYQSEKEVSFINVKVRFPISSEVSYTTTSNNSVTNVEQALNDLYKKAGEMYE